MIYKLTLDFSSINLNMLIEEFTKNNIEVCFGEDCLYIVYVENPKMVPISNILRKKKIQKLFSQHDTPRQISNIMKEKRKGAPVRISYDIEKE